MKYFAILCAAVVILFVAAMNVDPLAPRWYSEQTAEDVARRALMDRAATAHRLHREYMLADSLVPLLSSTPGITIGLSPLALDSPDTIRAIAEAELAGIAPLEARIGLFLVDLNYGAYDAVSRGLGRDGYHVFTGVDGAGPYCAVAVSVFANPASPVLSPVTQLRQGGGTRRGRQVPFPMGPCRFWAAYGAPGPAIDAWLRQGGYYFASVPATELVSRDTSRRRDIFGRASYDVTDSRTETCLTRDAGACVAVFTSPRIYWNSGPGSHAAIASQASFYRSGVFGRGDRALVAKLEERFGGDQFAEFWTSSLPMEQAFEAAFGVNLESWLRDITSEYYYGRAAGPRMSVLTWLLSLTLVAALVAVSWVLAQRRQIA